MLLTGYEKNFAFPKGMGNPETCVPLCLRAFTCQNKNKNKNKNNKNETKTKTKTNKNKSLERPPKWNPQIPVKHYNIK